MSRFSQSNGIQRPAPLSAGRAAMAWLIVTTRRWHIIRWGLAVIAALVLAASVTNARGRASAAQERWSNARSVWVASSEIEAGSVISASDVESLQLPVAAIPIDATTDDPTGRRLSDSVTRGEILRDGRLASNGVGPVAALLQPDNRGVTLQIDEGSVLEVGDRVELLALVGGRALADAAEVIAVDGRWATFSVPADRVSAVVNEIAIGGVMPVLVP